VQPVRVCEKRPKFTVARRALSLSARRLGSGEPGTPWIDCTRGLLGGSHPASAVRVPHIEPLVSADDASVTHRDPQVSFRVPGKVSQLFAGAS
jgi:hypothetical protein